jgi:thermostable 8-oxoguanine DNA glycosylase
LSEIDLATWFKDINSTECKGLEEIRKLIESWVNDDKKDWESLREKSNDERFIRFVLELLRRGQGDIYVDENKISTELKIHDIPSLNFEDLNKLYKAFRKELIGVKKKEAIFRKLDQSTNQAIRNHLTQIKKLFDYTIRYRWGSWQATYVIIGARSVINPEDSGFNKYIREAKENSEDNDFNSDRLLQLKFVGFKVRDLALTQFLDEYIAIDQNVKNVIMKTGLIRYYNEQFNETVPENPRLSEEKQYLSVWKLLKRICKITNVAPRELDRVLWHFGGKYEDKEFSDFNIKNYSSM